MLCLLASLERPSPSQLTSALHRHTPSAWCQRTKLVTGCTLVRVQRLSANTRSTWSLANARQVIGYAPKDDSEVVYADLIRELILEPARERMVQGDARGGKGSR